jgi:hypothetical protein
MGYVDTRENLSALPPGTLVGSWKVVRWHARGTYGTLYAARNAEHPESELVALKMANYPGDPRYPREVELLSRVHHPHVPKLYDRGWWRHTDNLNYPYMDPGEGWYPGWPRGCNPLQG